MNPEFADLETFDQSLLTASAEAVQTLGQRLSHLEGVSNGHLANVIGFLLRGDLSAAMAIYSWESDKRVFDGGYSKATLAEFTKAFGSTGNDLYNLLKNR